MSAADGGGGPAEEAIRSFLVSSGYFAVRGIKVKIDTDEITDIDIWAYGLGSPTHRERVVVDSKWKQKAAHGFERLIWLEGLRRFVGAEHAILATTDSRESVRTAATRFGIRCIGPSKFEQLLVMNRDTLRLSEEEFLKAILPRDDKVRGRVRERFEASKSRLLRLDWDAVNSHVEDFTFYVEEIAKRSDPAAAIRPLLVSASYFLLSLDYCLRESSFMEPSRIVARIDEGLRFGNRGREGTSRLLDLAGRKKANDLLRISEQIPADIPAEFFGGHSNSSWLFDVARMLESAAYSNVLRPVRDLPPEAQSTIGVLVDYIGVDRRVIFDSRTLF